MTKPRGGGTGGGKAASRPAGHKASPRGGSSGGSGGRHPARLTASDKQQQQQQRQQQQWSAPLALQQRVLDVFGRALQPTLASPHLNAVLQSVKKALFERDFAAAFLTPSTAVGAADHTDLPPPLDAYAARWSPTRALCYAAILNSPLLRQHWPAGTRTARRRMVAIGGGAAETVAFGMLFADINTDGDTDTDTGTDAGDLVLVDSAPWESVVHKLCVAMTEDVHATAPLQRPLLLIQPRDRIAVDVRQRDVLQIADDDMRQLVATTTAPTSATLITLFFTLNELFTAGGIGAAAICLLRLTAAAVPGTLLLVVDSPGSYAETTVGSQYRRYPMRWLLNKILLEDAADDDAGPAWQSLHQDDAVWFRLPPGLVYPIRLEDMRYQIHLYVRI